MAGYRGVTAELERGVGPCTDGLAANSHSNPGSNRCLQALVLRPQTVLVTRQQRAVLYLSMCIVCVYLYVWIAPLFARGVKCTWYVHEVLVWQVVLWLDLQPCPGAILTLQSWQFCSREVFVYQGHCSIAAQAAAREDSFSSRDHALSSGCLLPDTSFWAGARGLSVTAVCVYTFCTPCHWRLDHVPTCHPGG